MDPEVRKGLVEVGALKLSIYRECNSESATAVYLSWTVPMPEVSARS